MKILKNIVMLLFIIIKPICAETILFKTNGFYYGLEASRKEISIKGYLIDLSFKQKECNKNLIMSLYRQINLSVNRKIITEKDYYLVTIDKKEYKIAKVSDLGKFLFNFPNIAKLNKRKEAFLCRKK